MSFTIEENVNFFNAFEGIRYVTGNDGLFSPNSFSGALFFYPGSPKKIVTIEVNKSITGKLEEKDVHILIGARHNVSSVREDIERNRPIIYEMCRSTKNKVFVLNLATMQVVEREDFVQTRPISGLNTLFVFENIRNNTFYCVVNPTMNLNNPIPDIHFYTWLLSYVYSQSCCLSPIKNERAGFSLDLGKQFMQAMSCLAVNTTNKLQNLFVSSEPFILGYNIGDMNEFDIPIPGEKVERFTNLVMKAINEVHPEKKGN